MPDNFKMQIGVKVIIYDAERKLFLALKRCPDQELEKAESYDVPGGLVENNEDLLSALRREIKEETGLSLDTHTQCELLTASTIVNKSHSQIVRLTYGLPKSINIEEVEIGEEHEDSALLPLEKDDNFHPLLNEALSILKERLYKRNFE